MTDTRPDIILFQSSTSPCDPRKYARGNPSGTPSHVSTIQNPRCTRLTASGLGLRLGFHGNRPGPQVLIKVSGGRGDPKSHRKASWLITRIIDIQAVENRLLVGIATGGSCAELHRRLRWKQGQGSAEAAAVAIWAHLRKQSSKQGINHILPTWTYDQLSQYRF